MKMRKPYLAMCPVTRVGEEWLRQVGEERLEDARALVDGELAVVEVDDDALVEALLERRLLLEVAVAAEEALGAEVVLALQVLDDLVHLAHALHRQRSAAHHLRGEVKLISKRRYNPMQSSLNGLLFAGLLELLGYIN